MTNFKYPTFIDLRYDFAFKSIFGTQGNEDLLLKLINAILPEKHFTSVSLMNNEQMGLRKESRRAVFDVFATTSDGSDFTIEMQLNDQADFNQRMVFYSSFPVQNLVKKGKVYVISFMNFRLRHSSNRLVYRYKMMEEEIHEIYGDWLSIYLCELPRLKKRAMSEMDYVEGWLHILRESVNFAGVPEGMDAHFSPVVEAARLQTVPEDEMMNYFKSVISDNERLEYGEDRFAEGLAKGKAEVAKAMIRDRLLLRRP